MLIKFALKTLVTVIAFLVGSYYLVIAVQHSLNDYHEKNEFISSLLPTLTQKLNDCDDIFFEFQTLTQSIDNYLLVKNDALSFGEDDISEEEFLILFYELQEYSSKVVGQTHVLVNRYESCVLNLDINMYGSAIFVSKPDKYWDVKREFERNNPSLPMSDFERNVNQELENRIEKIVTYKEYKLRKDKIKRIIALMKDKHRLFFQRRLDIKTRNYKWWMSRFGYIFDSLEAKHQSVDGSAAKVLQTYLDLNAEP